MKSINNIIYNLGIVCYFFSFIFIFSVFFGDSVEAQIKPWLAPVHSGTQMFSVYDGRASATVLATVEGADARKIRVAAVILLQRANNRVINLEGKEVTYLPGENNGTARLHVELALHQLPEDERFGQYDLLLDVWEGDRKGPPVTIKLTFPETLFAQPERVSLKVFDVFGMYREVQPASVWLRVTEGLARTSVRLSQAGPALHGQEPVGGLLAFDLVPPLDKQAPTQVAVRESKEFPRGESTGQILLTGSDNKPITIPFTVEVRSFPIIISFIAGFGVFIGWVVRRYLVELQEKRNAELQVGRVRDALAMELERRRDKNLSLIIADLHIRLDAAFAKLQLSDAAGMAEITKVQEELSAAVLDSETRRTNIRERSAALEAVLTAGWKVPPELSTAMGAAVSSVKEACNDALRWNIDAGNDTTKNAERDLIDTINDWLRRWRAGNVHLRDLNEFCEKQPNLGADVRQTVTNLLGVDPQDGVADGLQKHFESVHVIVANSTLLKDQILNALDLTCKDVARSVKSVSTPPSVQSLDQARQDITARRTGDLALPDGLSEIKVFAQNTFLVCRDAVSSANTNGNASVQEKLDANDYRQAASKLAETQSASQLKGNLGGAASSRAVTSPAVASTTVRAAPSAAPPPTPARVLVHMPPMTAGLRSINDINVPQTFRQFAKARAIQLVFSAAGFAALAYPIFSPTFTGTFVDIFGVWAWGFTMDLGVGGFVQQLQTRYPTK